MGWNGSIVKQKHVSGAVHQQIYLESAQSGYRRAPMSRRLRIGIIYGYYKDWIAGTYYLQNLLCALNTLSDPELPHIVVLTPKRKQFLDLKRETGYPFLSFFRFGNRALWMRALNKLSSLLLHKRLHERQRIPRVDALFPNPDRKYSSRVNKRIYWIPDFQDMHLPWFFHRDELLVRRQQTISIITSRDHLILSSRDAEKDLYRFYGEPKCITSVVPFAVTHPNYSAVNIEDVRKDFGIPEKYFLVSNQFWAHKNHLVVLRAIKHLQGEGIHIFVVFTGSPADYRNPDYYALVQDYVAKQAISSSVCFIGLIERRRQLRLMHEAIAVVQPSLFEGWSTVIEDAMAMNQLIVASRLDVHIEQLKGYPFSTYFGPSSHEDLAKTIALLLETTAARASFDYSSRVWRFAQGFLSVARKSSSSASDLDRPT